MSGDATKWRQRVGALGWLAVGGSLVSAAVTFTSHDKWLRVGIGLSTAALMVAWAVALIRRESAGRPAEAPGRTPLGPTPGA